MNYLHIALILLQNTNIKRFKTYKKEYNTESAVTLCANVWNLQRQVSTDSLN
jgi:hypothetical protein